MSSPDAYLVVEEVMKAYNSKLIIRVHRVDILEELDLIQALVKVVLVVLCKAGAA